MSASYVWRMDDVAPTMDWDAFHAYLDLFSSQGIVPLLGVVPDNQDPRLMVRPARSDFWDVLRGLHAERRIEVAQHGYQHCYVSDSPGLLTRRLSLRRQSEFAGLPYETQREHIARGRDILGREGLASDVWMAPSHSFDRETLRALRDEGFRFVTDGIGLFPYVEDGLTFVPQQMGRARSVPAVGIWTVALHVNDRPASELLRLQQFLRRGPRSIRFSEAAARPCSPAEAAANSMFALLYTSARRLRGPASHGAGRAD